MLSPRTLLFAFAIAGFAQNGPLTCGGQAATPTIRAEGVAELVGDIVIACNGGNPTPADRVAPQINIQIFTQPAINITSRVTTSGGNLIEFTEALLLIDVGVSTLSRASRAQPSVSGKAVLFGPYRSR